jgi:hypothetical protein
MAPGHGHGYDAEREDEERTAHGSHARFFYPRKGDAQGDMPGLSARLLAFAAFAAGVGALLSACILVVPSARPGGPHCKFAGIESPCGQCVAESCIEAVDSCCVDDACGGVIADLESCSTQRTQSCATLTNADDAYGAHL